MRLKEVREILYADKRFLVSINRAEEDGILHTQYGVSVPVKRGEIVVHHQSGNDVVLTEDQFNKYYIPVRKQIYERMAKGYQEMGEINLEEANASVHTYNDGLEELEKDSKTLRFINKIY